jgi:hypothetical protein
MARCTALVLVDCENSRRHDWPPFGEHVGPDVVWRTDSDEPNARALAIEGTDRTDKTAMRRTVDVPEQLFYPARSEGLEPPTF